MCTRDNANGSQSRGAFTLLEVMIAVGILAMITISIWGFLRSNLNGIRISKEVSAERQAVVGLVKMLETELQDLPPRVNGAIQGIPHKFNSLQSDEMQWYCRAGNGLFTGSAEGEWYSTLTIQPTKENPRLLEIGLRRRPIEAKEKDYVWLPLLQNVSALEIRYWDRRLNTFLERWNDKNVRPSLVRIRIWRDPNGPPTEAVLTVPSAVLQQ